MIPILNVFYSLSEFFQFRKFYFTLIIMKCNIFFNILIFIFFASCSKRIDLLDSNNNSSIQVEKLEDKIKIVFKDSIEREINLIKTEFDEYILKEKKGILITTKSLSLDDSVFMTKETFYKKYDVYDNELRQSVYVNNFNYKINENLYVNQISFSPSPKYCLKIYYDSTSMIKKVYYRFGDNIISVKSKEFTYKKEEYSKFLNFVKKDSLLNLKDDLVFEIE